MSSPLGASVVAPSTQTYQLLPAPPATAGARHVTFVVITVKLLVTVNKQEIKTRWTVNYRDKLVWT